MKEDVLEQIVDDYLQSRGYFTRHNVRYGPPSVQGTPSQAQSDLDFIGYVPRPRAGASRVMVVSCKSWQDGFNTQKELTALVNDAKSHGVKARWMFRELWFEEWAMALHRLVAELTGESTFDYRIAVTRLTGTATDAAWATNPTIQANLGGCSFAFLRLGTMWYELLSNLTTTPAPSEIGRLAQLLKAAGVEGEASTS
jgi:hypothetical protein